MKTKDCKGSGMAVTGCKWKKKTCLICGRKFFPFYSTGKWKMPKHDRKEDGK